MGYAVVTAVWWSIMLSFSIALLREAFTPKEPEQIEGHRFGDCTDEMFEAMREVDAMGLSGEPLLQARLPPRSETSMEGLECIDLFAQIWRDPRTGIEAPIERWRNERRVRSVRDL